MYTKVYIFTCFGYLHDMYMHVSVYAIMYMVETSLFRHNFCCLCMCVLYVRMHVSLCALCLQAQVCVCVGKGSSQWLELRTVYHHVFSLALDQSVCPLFIKGRLDDA